MRVRCLDLLSLQQKFYWRLELTQCISLLLLLTNCHKFSGLKYLPFLLVLQVRRPTYGMSGSSGSSQGLKARFCWVERCHGFWEESISKLTQVVGRIWILAVVEMRLWFLACYWLEVTLNSWKPPSGLSISAPLHPQAINSMSNPLIPPWQSL